MDIFACHEDTEYNIIYGFKYAFLQEFLFPLIVGYSGALAVMKKIFLKLHFSFQ